MKPSLAVGLLTLPPANAGGTDMMPPSLRVGLLTLSLRLLWIDSFISQIVTPTTKISSHSAVDIVTQLVMLAVACVGLTVIAGWHLHLRVLVQVFGGVIPMQYNTALCFIALAVSGWMLVTRRVHWLAPVFGGAFIAVMGALVVYEYATKHSIGIDTLFFYPWLRTLSADPGRMALTTAISFVTSGSALILLSLRRTAVATFAILHSVPVSLGLTSAMGYLVGVTLVLPFNLGSQMAVHTALSFLGYGGVMLAYAWRQAPHTSEGTPRWASATGVLIVPILFVGISISAQRTSALASAVLLVMGLLAAGLFALATRRLTHSNVRRKGLILISVPLVFLFVFVVLVTQLSRKNRQAETSYLQSKEIIATLETISTDLFEAESSVSGYVVTGDPEFAESYRRPRLAVMNSVARLQELVQDNPQQQARAVELGAKASEKLELQDRLEQLVRDGRRDQAMELIKSAKGLHLMNDIRRAEESFLNEEQRLDTERRQAAESSLQAFNWLLVAGSSIDVFLALILAILFSTGISKRIVALTKNAQALAKGERLGERMKGTDEIAHLDHVFHEMAEALEEAAKKERAIFDNALDVICMIDREGMFLRVSPSSFKVWGYHPEELVGKHYRELLIVEEHEKSAEADRELFAGKALTDYENRYRRKDGSIVDMLWSAWWSESDRAVFAMARDITERKRAEYHLAYYDSLTELPNRALFEDRLPQAITLARRNHQKLAVMLLDLDRFKTINDTLGHPVGDQLLRGVAERLSSRLRGSDTVARFAGDGFALLLTQINRTEDAARIAQRIENSAVEVAQGILGILRSPFDFDGQELYVTASIGIGVFPNDGRDTQALLQNAGAALSRVKEQGGNAYQFYAVDMNAKALQQLTLENGLRRALEREEFVLHYQPQVDINSGRVVAVEALIRWEHPELGFVSPADFIPLAESNGLIIPIGEWTLRTACKQAQIWRKGGLPLRMSVNLSARQFEQPDLLEMVDRVLRETGLDPSHLEFEITESAVMKNAERAIDTLHRLKKMQIQIAIDDFGSGYSSLSYLKRFPIDRLKIDQSFVREATADSTDAAIIMAIITLAQNLRLKVIAEGVETDEQLRFLRLLRCDEIQGYLFSKPLPADALETLLLEGSPLAVSAMPSLRISQNSLNLHG
jgi:diguanylate cyclase (GGDEF)-like protein/PAS domain S-box-containing protein